MTSRILRRGLRAAVVGMALLAISDLTFISPSSSPAVRVPSQTSSASALQARGPSAEDVPMAPSHAEGFAPWRLGAAVLMALLLALVPLDGAEAARSGGRMGGTARRAAPQRSAPSQRQQQGGGGFARGGGPNISIGVGPMFAPPIFAPSPFFAPPLFGPPILPVPIPSGPSAQDQIIRDQQSRDERTIDQQKMQIEQMQKEIQELKAKKQ
mmetsp:Transcript_91976/g.231245  ORF Transcript_91976/g.231245 Transcript_91976/m.231245 type:complete len:211 (+) Transcript_91976:134-766(+)